jgi:hypothetical protein
MHDRQSLHHDRIQFAPIPSVTTISDLGSPTWVDPFREIDGKWGAYIGVHISYLRTTNLRYYFYDNKADPIAVNKNRLYGWHTKFHSLAWQHQLTQRWRIMMQGINGSTLMGQRSVYANFDSWYLASSYGVKQDRITLRIDYHRVKEDDAKPLDPNNSHGSAVTLAWRHEYTDNIELGAEFHHQKSDVDNRLLVGVSAIQVQSTARLVLAYTF